MGRGVHSPGSPERSKKPRFELFDEPAFAEGAHAADAADAHAADAADAHAFLEFLKAHADPHRTWLEQIEALALHDEFDLVGPGERPRLFEQWAAAHTPAPQAAPQAAPAAPAPDGFFTIVRNHSRPGLFYAYFKREFGHLPGFKEYPEKQREIIYRDYLRFMKKSPEERQELKETYEGDGLRLRVLEAVERDAQGR